jgi:ribonuclease P protein component
LRRCLYILQLEQQQRYTLGKEERLKSRKQIEHLFKTARSFNAGMIKVFHQLHETAAEEVPHPLQFGVGVGTRHFKHAVDRNRIKRLIREAYRLQKQELKVMMTLQQKQLNLFFVFTGKELPAYELVVEAVNTALSKLQKLYQ